jgi:hypothetical protein
VEIPPSGFYIATLVTNDVISIEGDQRVLRHTGDSWAVLAGEPLVLELQGKNHTVLLEVFRVELPDAIPFRKNAVRARLDSLRCGPPGPARCPRRRDQRGRVDRRSTWRSGLQSGLDERRLRLG